MLLDIVRPFGVFDSPTQLGAIADAIAYEERRLALLQGTANAAAQAGDKDGPHQAAVKACEDQIAFLKIRQRDAEAHVAKLRKGPPTFGEFVSEELQTFFGTWKK